MQPAGKPTIRPYQALTTTLPDNASSNAVMFPGLSPTASNSSAATQALATKIGMEKRPGQAAAPAKPVIRTEAQRDAGKAFMSNMANLLDSM